MIVLNLVNLERKPNLLDSGRVDPGISRLECKRHDYCIGVLMVILGVLGVVH